MRIRLISTSGVYSHRNSLYAIIYFTMLHNIANILQQECNLHQSDRLLVGVSGGPDSLCLLHLLHSFGYELIAAHINHQLRSEAFDEARYVERFSSDLGIKLVSTETDVQGFAREQSLSLEEAARIVRYRYLFEQADEMAVAAVLVAHTADDQVETILMHLLRGTGLSGLRGMEYRLIPNPWSNRIPLVRPLLTTWRSDIMLYLAENEIEPVIDQSNQNTAFFRNRLRHDLLPLLDSYHPGVRQNLLRLSLTVQDDYVVLQQLVDRAWEVNLARHSPAYLAFRRAGVLKLPVSIQRYLLRKAIAYHLPGLQDVDFETIERGLKFLAETKPYGQVDLVAGLWLIRDVDLFWITFSEQDLPHSEFPSLSPGEVLFLSTPSTVSLDGDWQLQAVDEPDLAQAIQLSTANSDPYQAWLDLGTVKQPLVLRSRVAGDRIQPIGMDSHSMKVSDLMVNLKLPKRARKTWPLVCSADHILWIPGYRVSELALVKPGSISVVHLTLSRNLST